MLKNAGKDYGKVKAAMSRFEWVDSTWPDRNVMSKATGEAVEKWNVVQDGLLELDTKAEQASLETLTAFEKSVEAFTTARAYWLFQSANSLYEAPLNEVR